MSCRSVALPSSVTSWCCATASARCAPRGPGLKDRVSVTVDGHVADVMLDRADKMNAIDLRMFEALVEAADHVASLKGVRAVVLHADGDNFCAGIDVSVLGNTEMNFHEALATPLAPSPANLFQRSAVAWRELEMPVIAALQGATFGGGFQIAMGADVRFASPGTKMSIMESKWGLIPDMGITSTVRHILRPDLVKELAWTARVFAAEEARDMGLVTQVVEDPLAAARALANECANRSPQAVRGIKRLVNDGWTAEIADGLALEASLQGHIIGSSNQSEAIQANLEKRTPDFED